MPPGRNVCSSVRNTDLHLSRQQDQPPQTQTLAVNSRRVEPDVTIYAVFAIEQFTTPRYLI
jgi:hypothetical protein